MASDALIKTMLKRAKKASEDSRKDNAQKLLDYYRGDYNAAPTNGSGYGHLTNRLAAIYPKQYKKMVPHIAVEPLLRPIAEEIAKTFIKPVTFAIDGDTGNKREVLAGILPSDWQMVLKTIDPLKIVLKSPHIRVNWRDDHVQWDIITPNVLDVVQDELDPTKAVAYCVIQTARNTVADTVTRYHVWTENSFWIEDTYGKIIGQVEDNPYGGQLPFVAINDEYPIDSYFNPLPLDLINAQERANLLKTYLDYLLAYSNPMWIFYNTGKKSNPTSGPGGIYKVDQVNPDIKSSVETITPDADPEKYQRLLDAHISATRKANGLTPYRDTGQVSSGIALKLENYNVLERRADAVEMWRSYLHDLFAMTITVHNAHAPKGKVLNISPDSVSFDFAEIEFPTSRKEKQETWEKDLELGLKAPADVLMEDNPDITDRDIATQMVIDNKAATKAMQSRFTLSSLVSGGDNAAK